jgi:MFS family permease
MKQSRNGLVYLLGVMGFLAAGDVYSAAPLLLNMTADLHVSMGEAMLTVTAYMVAFGVFTLFFGPLSDRYGKTKILLASTLGTAVFSCLCLVFSDITPLVLCRFAQRSRKLQSNNSYANSLHKDASACAGLIIV